MNGKVKVKLVKNYTLEEVSQQDLGDLIWALEFAMTQKKIQNCYYDDKLYERITELKGMLSCIEAFADPEMPGSNGDCSGASEDYDEFYLDNLDRRITENSFSPDGTLICRAGKTETVESNLTFYFGKGKQLCLAEDDEITETKFFLNVCCVEMLRLFLNSKGNFVGYLAPRPEIFADDTGVTGYISSAYLSSRGELSDKKQLILRYNKVANSVVITKDGVSIRLNRIETTCLRAFLNCHYAKEAGKVTLSNSVAKLF